MENWIQDVIAKWRSEGVELNPPVSITEIENAESILDFRFPTGFKDFYLQANGFEGFDWQEHMFTLWPLNLIVEEFKSVHSNGNFIGFSDWLLASHMIGFNKNKPGIFKSYHNDDGEFIADSFDMFIDMINSNNNLIY